MSIHWGIPCRACQLFAVLIRDVLTCFRVPITFGEAEVYDVNDVIRLLLWNSNQEVVWLDISVEKVIVVQELYPLQDLISYHQYCLQGELSFAECEQILQTLTKQVHHHCVVVSFHSKPMHSRNSHYSLVSSCLTYLPLGKAYRA